MDHSVSFISLGGGIGGVTKNMYLYEYQNEILIVDCGLGFADETMLGVDLLLPDVSYLLQTKKRIVGLLLTHGHEDHIGALPFILPQLLSNQNNVLFPLYGSPLTAALANEKLKEFGVSQRVTPIQFDKKEVLLGAFKALFIHVTHSIPDTSHIFIKTPVGNFYHGSDFKFEDFPFNGKTSDLELIKYVGSQNVTCLMSDCLGSERPGRTQSEKSLVEPFEREIKSCPGKFIVTTYSSNIARINQILQVSEMVGRRVCFIGRSLIKTKDVALKLGYLRLRNTLEVSLDQIKNYPDNKLTLLVAGSQGQEESAMARIANGEHREVKLTENDTVIFSADPIPGNEVLVYELIDTIAKQGVRVLYSALSREFHVSGHGSQDELLELISLVKPKQLLPIGGAFRHMVMYRNLAQRLGYKKSDVHLIEDGQEVVFGKESVKLGRTIPVKNVYVDEVSGEELESYILRDRQKLSEGGIVTLILEIDSANGQLVDKPDVIVKGFLIERSKRIEEKLFTDIRNALKGRKGRVTNWVYMRKFIGEVSERRIFKELRRRPLVLPVVIEV